MIIPIIKLFDTQIYLFLQGFQAYVSPPITAIFIWGLIFKFVNTRAAMMTLIVGELVGLIRLSLDGLVNNGILQGAFWLTIVNINFLHFAIFLFLFSSVLILSISLATTKNSQIVPKNWYMASKNSNVHSVENVGFLGNPSALKNSIFLTIFLFIVILSVWGLWI